MVITQRLSFAGLLLAAACAGEPAGVGLEESALGPAPRAGLGLYFFNGQHDPDLGVAPRPVQVVDGPRRYLQEVYLVAKAPTTDALGLAPVSGDGDFAGLDWSGLQQADEDWRLEASGATWARTRLYRDARWMTRASTFRVKFIDAAGRRLGPVLELDAGSDHRWRASDDMFLRRFVARVVTLGCAAEGDCANAGATSYAEALVQLRAALDPEQDFAVPADAVRVDVAWSEDPGHVRSAPVVHLPPDDTGQGFDVELAEVAPPARGYYLPGEAVQVRITFADGAGRRLFPPGALPTYGEMLARAPAARGLRYLTFQGDPLLWWARKDLQGAVETFFAGPLHRMSTVGTTAFGPAELFLPQIQIADPAHDGWTGLVQEMPQTAIVIGCLYGDPAACAAPASDIYSFVVPAGAEPGTYLTGTKARREWMGEPVLRAATLRIQVGQKLPTSWPGFTVPGMDNDCRGCHQGVTAVSVVHHGFPGDRVSPACLACHSRGYYFEPDAAIDVRLRILHETTRRLRPPSR